MELRVKPNKVILLFGTIILFLLLAHVAGQFSTFYLGHNSVFRLVPLFDLDIEHNIPTLYSSVAILFCSVLLMIIAFATRKNGKKGFLYWIGLAVIFLFLSIDEVVAIHERFTPLMRQVFNASESFNLYIGWIIPYGGLVIILFFAYIKFIGALPSRVRLLFIIAGVTFVTGALVLEFLSGFHVQEGQKNLTYVIFYTFEELFEMLGILIFMSALLSYIDTDLKGLYFRISSS